MSGRHPLPKRIPSGIKHGHQHYWCTQACKDNDCDFGPCCDASTVRARPFEGEVEVW